MKNNDVMVFFFRSMGVGFIIAAIRLDYEKISLKQIVNNLLTAYGLNTMSGIWFGVSSMMIYSLISYLHKKINDE